MASIDAASRVASAAAEVPSVTVQVTEMAAVSVTVNVPTLAGCTAPTALTP